MSGQSNFVNVSGSELNLYLSVEEIGGVANYTFSSYINAALTDAEKERFDLLYSINENLNAIKDLTPECDKSDYSLAACSGALCGIIDIFLVGAPKDSALGSLSDKWFQERTMDFAKLCGWNDNGFPKSAILYLQNKFPVPYDQTGMMEAALRVFGLNTTNHHFKSLGHNPSLLGLFFSILDQFGDSNGNTAHFVMGKDLIIWSPYEGQFELRGNTVPAKMFSGFMNWLGHLMSDVSGSYDSKGRGAGIPSPLWTWTNDIVAIKQSLHIPVSDFDRAANELALNIYTKGYDMRFQAAQAIPVFINEMIVRSLYSVRRMVRYFSQIQSGEFSFQSLWNNCEPFSNATVKRMLTVAHGVFCSVDLVDAAVRGAVAGPVEFFLHLNLPGLGRFAVSLFGEAERVMSKAQLNRETDYLQNEKDIVNNYIAGLLILQEVYNDRDLVSLTDDIKKSDLYAQAFSKSVQLAEKRGVPEEKILRTKEDIDAYFRRGDNQ